MRTPTRFVLLVAACVASLDSACTLLTSFDECTTDADCMENVGPRARCGPEKLCVLPTDVAEGLCGRSDDNPRAGTIGTTDDPRGLLVGILLPLTGPEAGFGVPLLNAIELAYSNFDQIGGIGDRPLGLLVCDTEGVDDSALEAADQAITNARVTAVIGPDFSSQTIDIATQLAIPNDVLLVTPSGTAAAITGLADKNLVWRTAPSDTAQAAAIAALVEHYITEIQGVGLSESVVWLLTRQGDPYSDGLQQGLISNFPSELTNGDNFHPSVYPETWPEWFTATGSQLPAPDVVLIMGAAESWDIAEAIDDRFDTSPTFFFADAARNSDEAGSSSVALTGRILGTAPRAVGDPDYTPYTLFRVKYEGEFDVDPNEFQFVANAYDALHLVALAAAGGGGVSGPQLAVGMGKLSEGDAIAANFEDAQRGVLLLSQGETVDFQGASGRLDFDENGDPSASSITLWCFEDGGVPEVGELLNTDGTFTPITCMSTPDNNTPNSVPNNTTPDMGMDVGAGD